jgi:hypothetical protein
MHLEVDPTMLSETAGDLRRCVGVAREFPDHRGRLREMVESCGAQHLHEAADHFIGRWGYGMGLLAGDAEHLAGQLERSADRYRRLEAEISRSAR